MKITDFKFYRKNNRYYFESDLLEGKIYLMDKKVNHIVIDNGDDNNTTYYELIDLFNSNIAAVLGAEEV